MTRNTPRAIMMTVVAQATGPLVSLITFPLIARFGGADDYGAYVQVTTLATFIVPFAALGLGTGAVRFFASRAWDGTSRQSLLRTAGVVAGATGAIALLLALVAGPLNALVLGWEDGERLFRWSAPLVVIGGLEGLLLGLLRARHRFTRISLYSIGFNVAFAAAALALLPTFGIVALVQATIFIKLAALVVLMGAIFRDPLQPDSGSPPPRLPRMIAYGLPVSIVALGGWLMNLGDRLVIGSTMSPEDLGLYVAVFNFCYLILVVNVPLNMPFYPRLVEAFHSRGEGAAESEVKLFHRYQTLLLVPSLAFLIVGLPVALLVMGGGEFRASHLLVGLVVLPLFIDQWNSSAHYVLQAADDVVFTQNMWLGMGIVNLLANLWVVPRAGLIGAAGVSVVTFVILNAVFYLRACRHVDLRTSYHWGLLVKTLLAAGLAAGASYPVLALGASVSALVAAAAVFTIVYALLVVAMREVGMTEIAHLKRALHFRTEARP